MPSHLAFHRSFVSDRQILSYPFALTSDSSRRMGVLPLLLATKGADFGRYKVKDALAMSERLRKVEIVAQGSQSETSSVDIVRHG